MSSAQVQRCAVLGVGAMGPVVVQDLALSPHIQQITMADLDEAKAQNFARKLASKKVVTRGVDIDDRQSLVKLLHGHEAVINCTPYVKNVAVMEAALEAGVHYLDLGGLYHETLRQLKFHEKFRRAGLLAVLGIGGSPGITNVMARYAVDRLDRVEEIKIRVASVFMDQPKNPLPVPYSLTTILDEFTKRPVIFQNGKFEEVAPLSGQEMLALPEPVGTVEAVYTLHSELATLPEFFKEKGIRDVSFKVAFPAAFFERLRLLVDLGFAETQPIEANGVSIVPREFLNQLLARSSPDEKPPASSGILRVEVQGEKSGKPFRYALELFRSPRPPYPGSSPTAITTGLPPSIVAQMIASGKIQARGVLPPEACIPAERFFAELAQRGLKIILSVQQPVDSSGLLNVPWNGGDSQEG